MKKIVLKKKEESYGRSSGYRINYSEELNAAQYEAVMHNNGAALVIAGAGSGKTRTLVYRVARLVEDGVPPESILLLTFTRKSAAEMVRRAATLLDGRCEKVSGGTFHSFALKVLRKYSVHIGYDPNFNVLDQSDSEDTINLLRNKYIKDRKKKRFPQKSTLFNIYSLSVNRRESIKELVEAEYPSFIDDLDKIESLIEEYNQAKAKYGLMDYDDLLVKLLELLKTAVPVREEINRNYKYVMVDEYQDTNKLQHEIALILAGRAENLMAVGDDAQSIYSFRGANFQNIMFMPESFSACKVYKLEENYRSSQPLLDFSNAIIRAALFRYEKELFTRRIDGFMPAIISAANERQQSAFVAQRVLELREEGIPLNEIAVLFRSSFLSFDLEIELNKSNIPYRKFGGMKFIETAHIKDLVAFLRIVNNPKDAVSWQRCLLLLDGVGPATSENIVDRIASNELSLDNYSRLSEFGRNKDNLRELFSNLSEMAHSKAGVGDKTSYFANYYRSLLKKKYDDWQKRWRDIETFIGIAERYSTLSQFLNEMAIDPPVESLAELEPESKEDEFLTLSTIHSAKGLEWKAVIMLWALEGRFPSAKSVNSLDSLEEERRLFYVACTRAKDYLYICYPVNIYDRESGFVLSEPSRFLSEISEEIADKYYLEEEGEEI